MNFLGLLKRYSQFIKFSLVGVSNTLITFVLYYILVKLGLHYMISNILGYAAGIINSYILNSTLVFKSNYQVKNKLLKFIIVNIGTLLLSSIMLYIFVGLIGINKILSQILSSFFILCVNYIGNKLWTFRDVKDKTN